MKDDKERCPKCSCSVYAMHQGKEWHLECSGCGLKTDIYDTYKKARKEWDEMVEREGGDEA